MLVGQPTAISKFAPNRVSVGNRLDGVQTDARGWDDSWNARDAAGSDVVTISNRSTVRVTFSCGNCRVRVPRYVPAASPVTLAVTLTFTGWPGATVPEAGSAVNNFWVTAAVVAVAMKELGRTERLVIATDCADGLAPPCRPIKTSPAGSATGGSATVALSTLSTMVRNCGELGAPA